MFPGSNPLTLTKILSGISKSLNIAGQIVPIYNQVTPMISGAKNIYNKIKNININTTSKVNNTLHNKSTTISSSTNRPVFFK